MFLSNAGTTGSEVARIMHRNGNGDQRFRLVKPQIPNSHYIYFLDATGNERGKIYMWSDNVLVMESATANAIKLKASETAGGVPLDRLVLKGGTRGSSGIEVYENLVMQTVSSKYQSIVLPVKGGTLNDADFNSPANGLIAIDSTNGRIYFRYGGAWHYVNQTAGFEIPSHETACQACGKPLKVGQEVKQVIDSQLSDGALHGHYEHRMCP